MLADSITGLDREDKEFSRKICEIFEVEYVPEEEANLEKIRIPDLVAKTKGFSGADIEGVVKDAVEMAFVDGKDAVGTQDILDATSSTNSLSDEKKPIYRR